MATAASSHVDMLVTALRESERKTDEEWMAALSQRKVAELEFHDRWRNRSQEHGSAQPTEAVAHANTKYYSTTGLSRQYMSGWIERHARGRVFLDYACGDGDNTILAARSGAAMSIGLDISRVSVENGKRRAAAEGLSGNTYFVQGDCENTGLPSNSIDAVICCGMLHHLDLSYAFPELRRILKPGGVCLAYEALDYNPLIKLYRTLTPAMRTDWEKHHILSHKDLEFARRFFDVVEVKYWHLCSILATPLRKTRLFGPALRLANGLDRGLLKVFPLSRMAWIFTFELRKRSEA